MVYCFKLNYLLGYCIVLSHCLCFWYNIDWNLVVMNIVDDILCTIFQIYKYKVEHPDLDFRNYVTFILWVVQIVFQEICNNVFLDFFFTLLVLYHKHGVTCTFMCSENCSVYFLICWSHFQFSKESDCEPCDYW